MEETAMLNNLSVGMRMAMLCVVVIFLFVVTLLKVGISLSGHTQDIRQINKETLPFVLVVDEMDLKRSEVQQFLTDVSATHDRDGYEESAKRFLGGEEKFKQMFRRENDTQGMKAAAPYK
jgi:methyl-accepting chemotaxis protein